MRLIEQRLPGDRVAGSVVAVLARRANADVVSAHADKTRPFELTSLLSQRPNVRWQPMESEARRSNRALLTDTYTSPLRAQRGAAKRRR
jgi:hypothetical protein